MKLSLRYNKSIHNPVHAACIRSSNVYDWLREINRWKIPLHQLDCYVLPSSHNSIDPSALFIIFKDAEKIKQHDLLEPYTCMENILFIPVNAILAPQMSKEEIKTLLLWEVQVFHPTIGLIGFEKKDRIDLSSLISFNNNIDEDWSFAHTGMPDQPKLSQINVVQPTPEGLIESIQKEIGEKKLKDIPPAKEGERSASEKIIDTIKYGLFKVTAGLVYGISQLLSFGGSNNKSGSEAGLLQQLQQWLSQNIEELEKKRNKEINRLLNLFDKDTDEALQYAIPLNSPYLNRGSQTSSSSLSRNPLQFNLNKLGGGRVVDTWNIGDQYNELRNKYLKAAQHEIEKKDFRKAAYVYAHLLGDYHNAAKVLEQGKYYREAAALYKDHLKNKMAAAECLENGELYLDAIELYKDLHKDEKVGDLYTKINHTKQAAAFYEKHVDLKVKSSDFLDAARVMEEKLHQQERARETLMTGWEHSYQHEACLKKYFDLLPDDHAIMQSSRDIYANHTPRHKKVPFLNIMEYVYKKSNDEEVNDTIKEIAYEIVHDEAANGNLQPLFSLSNFLPHDRLIHSDASRFSSAKRNRIQHETPKAFHLDDTIKWIKAISHRTQFLAIGIKNSMLYMTRGNWYGNLEYYSWTNPIKPYTQFTFAVSPYFSGTVLLHSSDGLPITRKNLPRNKYFNDGLTVSCPVWLHKTSEPFTINGQSEICRFSITNKDKTLHYYNMNGDLKQSVNCVFENDFHADQLYGILPLINNGQYFYTYKDKYFFIISETGKAKAFAFDTSIRLCASSTGLSKFLLIVSTNRGCLLYYPSDGNMNLKGGFFAQQLTPSGITFITSDRFVIYEKRKAYLFIISDNETYMIQEYKTSGVIVSVIPAYSRNEFALLEENGRITVCQVT